MSVMRYIVAESVVIEAANSYEASNIYAQQLGFKDYQALHEACHREVRKAEMIYATPFNNTTKEATGPSTPLHVFTLDAAEVIFPNKPISRTKNTLIYEQFGDTRLCVSWIRFKI